MTYNLGTNLATYNIDITNIFNESNYKITFNNPPFKNPYPESTDILSNIQLRYKNPNTSTLSAFLGFNDVSYYPNTIFSKRNIPLQEYTLNSDNIDPCYNLDSSNNYFTIYQYLGPKPMNNYNITSTRKKDTIIIQLSLTGNYTRNAILNDLNKQLQENPKLINSKMERIDIIDPSGNNIDISNNHYHKNNINNSCFKLTIQLNKKTTLNSPNLKTVVIFPDETIQNNNIWVNNTTIYNSCFEFKESINELNTIKAESSILQSSYIIKENTYFVLKCITDGYEITNYNGLYNDGSWNTIDNSWNDYKIKINKSTNIGYDLNNYINEVNKAINITNIDSSNNSNINGIFNSTKLINNLDVNNNLLFRFDINKRFTTKSYSIDLSNSILFDQFNIGSIEKKITYLTNNSNNNIDTLNDKSNIKLSTYNNITITTDYSISYVVTKPYILTIIPDTSSNEANRNAPIWEVPFIGNETSYGLFQFINVINKSFSQFSDNSYSYPLSGTELTCETQENGSIKLSLNIIINKVLTQNDYKIIFYDPSFNDPINNSWNKNFNLDLSYNLIDFSNNEYSYSDIPIKNVSSNNFYLPYDTTFTITPNTTGLTTSNGLNNNIDPIIITIPSNPKYYTIGEIKNIINTQFDLSVNSILKGSYLDIIDNYVYISFNINKIYTANDYKMVFYDLNSFVKCFVGSSSVRNVSWDSTLGWILGFRDKIEYFLMDYTDENNKIATFVGDTKITTNLYNYFLIVLDDYTQSHLNDGLVTLTPQENDISLPSYAQKPTLQCNTSNNPVFTGTLSNLPGKNLTQNQLYSANEIYKARQTKIKNYSLGPFIQDIFGLIPIKVSGLANGASYVEFGGTLQNQERVYFGPVNIRRMTIKLMNDKGEVVDLNGSNWSFSFICEQLYKNE